MSCNAFLSSIVSLFLLAAVSTAQARDISEVNLDIPVEGGGSDAKQLAFDKATEQATQQLVEQLLGVERATKYWPSLKAKLLKNSTRYVVFIKGTAPQLNDGQAPHIQVTLRLSPDNLENLLREQGVMSSSGVKILPLVEVTDPRGKTYVWWASLGEDEKSLAQDMFKHFYSSLANRFKSKNIYVMDPTAASFRMNVPANYRSEFLKREDQMLFAQYMKADALLLGKIAVLRSPGSTAATLTYDLQLVEAKSGREIDAVQKSEVLTAEIPKVVLSLQDQASLKVVEELVTHLVDVVASGNLNLNVVKLTIAGSLGFRQQSEIKRTLTGVREIRILKERLFEPKKVVFEVETPLSGIELGKILQRTSFPQMSVKLDTAQDDSLELSVHSSASAQ
jgi:hypothetical protein